MATSESTKPSPVEVWLRQQNLVVTCTVVHEDETTAEYDVQSLSMRGAQREMTGYLLRQGYSPVGRWDAEATDDDGVVEASRRFRLAK